MRRTHQFKNSNILLALATSFAISTANVHEVHPICTMHVQSIQFMNAQKDVTATRQYRRASTTSSPTVCCFCKPLARCGSGAGGINTNEHRLQIERNGGAQRSVQSGLPCTTSTPPLPPAHRKYEHQNRRRDVNNRGWPPFLYTVHTMETLHVHVRTPHMCKADQG